MKKHLLVLLILLLGVSFAKAAVVTHRADVGITAPVVMDVSAGMIVGGGSALPGVSAQVAANLKTDFPLYVGGELGLFFLTGNYSSGAVIPILGKVYTPIAISPRATFRAGLSAGPFIATTSGYSDAGFAFLFDPALIFGLGSVDLALQARFGVVGGTFVAIPEIGLTFAI